VRSGGHRARWVFAGALLLAVVGSVASAFALGGGRLSFLQVRFEGQGGVDGIASTYDVAASPDGHNVYAIGHGDDALATFKRDRHGKLHFVNAKVDGVGGVDGLSIATQVAVAPDGRSVYATGAGDNAVATFKRNRRGKLHFVNAKVDGVGGVDGLGGAYGVSVSRDGDNVYVTGAGEDSIATFKRNRRGKLHFVNAKFDNTGPVQGIDTPYSLGVSPDDRNVYVAGQDENALATFKRSRRTGKLKFVNEKVDGVGGVDGLGVPCCGLAISRDGRNVYVPGDGDHAIAIFKRNHSGKLRFQTAKFNGQGGISNMSDPLDVIASRDGKNAYVASYNDDALLTFKRRANGNLRYLGAKHDNIDGVDGLDGGWQLAISRDDRNVYDAAFDEDAVSAFKRHH